MACQLTASDALVSGLSCETIVRATLARIEERDAQVLAWVVIDGDKAIKRAQELDELPVNQRGILHGVTIAVKDIILTADFPTEFNSPIYKGSPNSGIDAGAVSVLRAQGAIVIGKTTTTEFASYRRTNKTKNPHDPTKTPGGSSSGSAAAVADGQVQIALGSQTAGSTIRPAAFNGCFSFKPTYASCPLDGIKALSPANDTLGFFARSIKDLQLMAKAFRLEDRDDIVPLSPTRPFRIGFCRTSMWSLTSPETRTVLASASRSLTATGAVVTQIDLPPSFDNIVELHALIMSCETRVTCLAPYLLASVEPVQDPPLIHPDFGGHVENKSGITRRQLLEAYDKIATLKPIIDEILGKFDAVLTPSAPDVAPGIEGTGDPRLCTTWTILGVPAINIPAPRNPGDLPIGLTLVGRRFSDLALLNAAQLVDDILKGKHKQT